MALNARQRRFVEEYLVDLNATQAAIRAGYSAKTDRSVGSENLTKPDIAAAIDAARQVRAEKLALTHEWVLAGLRENYERAMQARPVTGPDGSETGEYVWNGPVANKALELMGRHLGTWDRRSGISLPSIATAEGCAAAADAILGKAASGEITLEQATALSALVEGRRKAIETLELERRLSDLERQAAR